MQPTNQSNNSSTFAEEMSIKTFLEAILLPPDFTTEDVSVATQALEQSAIRTVKRLKRTASNSKDMMNVLKCEVQLRPIGILNAIIDALFPEMEKIPKVPYSLHKLPDLTKEEKKVEKEEESSDSSSDSESESSSEEE